jgi:hypothetical protein
VQDLDILNLNLDVIPVTIKQCYNKMLKNFEKRKFKWQAGIPTYLNQPISIPVLNRKQAMEEKCQNY